MKQEYKIDPVAKPRMTQRDKWHTRPATQKYWDFKNEVNFLGITVNESGDHITFILPMPKSWSKKKKALMNGKPHQQRGDLDNLLKALYDSIYDEDKHIWDCRATKLWGYEGKIIINPLPS